MDTTARVTRKTQPQHRRWEAHLIIERPDPPPPSAERLKTLKHSEVLGCDVGCATTMTLSDGRREFTAVTRTHLHGTRRKPAACYSPRPTDRQHDGRMQGVTRGELAVMDALRRRPSGATVAKLADVAGMSELLLPAVLRSAPLRRPVGDARPFWTP